MKTVTLSPSLMCADLLNVKQELLASSRLAPTTCIST